MAYVGFKSATIGVHDATGKIIATHVIEGKKDEGATYTAEITGLSSTPVKVAGSDVTYYISQRGTGNVVVNFGVLDLPDSISDVLLGYKVATNGITYIGKDTEAPYCSILMESSNLQGDKALFGLFKGKFTKEAINLNTRNPEETYTPEAETYVYTAAEDDKSGPSNGQTVGKYVGSDDVAIKALRDQVLPGGETAPVIPEG